MPSLLRRCASNCLTARASLFLTSSGARDASAIDFRRLGARMGPADIARSESCLPVNLQRAHSLQMSRLMGLVALDIRMSLSAAEMGTWGAERIKAFMTGLAWIEAARNNTHCGPGAHLGCRHYRAMAVKVKEQAADIDWCVACGAEAPAEGQEWTPGCIIHKPDCVTQSVTRPSSAGAPGRRN